MALKLFKCLYIKMNKAKQNAGEKLRQNVQQNRKKLIFLVHKEYLQINMAKITTCGESWANHIEDLQNREYKT